MSRLSADFTGEVVAVTGAANGLGLASAQWFAAAGATVVGIDHDERPSRRVAHESHCRSRIVFLSSSMHSSSISLVES